MSEANVLSINSFDNKILSEALENKFSTTETHNASNITATSNSSSGSNVLNSHYMSSQNNNACLSWQPYGGYTAPSYTWIAYEKDKLLVTKAENGFVLSYNSKVYIAKNETEVSKLIVKMMSPNKTNKEK